LPQISYGVKEHVKQSWLCSPIGTIGGGTSRSASRPKINYFGTNLACMRLNTHYNQVVRGIEIAQKFG
jgi:hypothetical protein